MYSSPLGVKHTAYPFPSGINLGDPAQVEKFISALESSAHALADAGIVLSYHNHAHEFHRLCGGKTILERIYDGTSLLQAELDTFWIARGGQDPVAWIHRVAGRMDVIHYKDYAVTPEGGSYETVIGEGNLDWKAITAACDATDVKWFAIEQDDVHDGTEPFDCLNRSFRFISETLC